MLYSSSFSNIVSTLQQLISNLSYGTGSIELFPSPQRFSARPAALPENSAAYSAPQPVSCKDADFMYIYGYGKLRFYYTTTYKLY